MLKFCWRMIFSLILIVPITIGLTADISFAEDSDAPKACKSEGVVGLTASGAEASSGIKCGDGGSGTEESEAVKKYRRDLATFLKCVEDRKRLLAIVPTVAFECVGPGAPPPDFPKDPMSLTNQQVAEMAAARLTIPEPTIVLGPDPQINPWKTAVIGVNYWFYATGPTSLPARGETVTGPFGSVSVHLSAKMTGLIINTNANQAGAPVIRCSGPGTPWPKGTSPNKPSPTCGHVYTKPTTAEIQVRATWTVYWEINGETGTVTLGRTTGLTVPIKELVSVNR